VAAGRDLIGAKIAELRGFRAHTTFEVDGESHSLYIAAAESSELMLASKEAPLSARIKDPKVASLSETFRSTMNEYWTVTKQLGANQNDAALLARARGLRASAEKILLELRGGVLKWMKTTGSNVPHRHAPTIGFVDRHDDQLPRLRPKADSSTNIAAWRMESEHVIPRAFVSALFSILPAGESKVSKSEYGSMHTVIMYQGASKLKTHGDESDLALIARLKNEVASSVTGALKAPRSVRSVKLGDTATDVITRFNALAARTPGRAADCAKEEQSAVGDARTPPGTSGLPRPTSTEIGAAFGQQRDEIRALFEGRLAKVEASRDKE
jgi:hypothetical protein